MATTMTKREVGKKRKPRKMPAKDVLRSISMALRCLTSDHVTSNRFRLGAIGSQEVESATAILQEVLDRNGQR